MFRQFLGAEIIYPNKFSFLPPDHGFTLTRWNTFDVDPQSLQTNKPGIFAGGDTVTGPATVIEAMAAGKRAAIMIDRYIRGLDLSIEESKTRSVIELTRETITDIEKTSRSKMPKLPLMARLDNFKEVELGYDEETAVREAERCLQCWTLVK